ncbi:MAG: TIGR03790 family protein, partial [Patescibacteria group bacterium]|nr:TIGR03790 family protein [Patescibacteria group bacterium]
MLLVVNPNDEASLRIASAYQRLRAIPDSNIIFVSPPTSYGLGKFDLTQAELMSTYITPVANALAERGLTDQIDYIGVIGQASRYVAPAVFGSDTRNSLTYALSLTTPIAAGLNSNDARYTATALYQNPGSIPIGGNPAIHHANSYDVYYPYAGSTISTQYYMGGAIGYTGVLGNSPAQVIAQLERSVAGDSTKPVGTVYFEENDDIRSNTRESQWTATKEQLGSRGVPWVEERNTSGSTPRNRPDVRGAVVGRATTTLPNGSTYLPGSWADNLTSYGATWSDRGQSKSTLFIASGAAATAGSVVEPYAVASRFTNSSIYTFIADGSTQGEAFFKSVSRPDIQMLIGDLLGQPYADVPVVQITSGPLEGSTVSGMIALNAGGSLVSPAIATGIAQVEFYVDGRLVETVAAGNASFTLDTTLLSDGYHQLRVVAVN